MSACMLHVKLPFIIIYSKFLTSNFCVIKKKPYHWPFLKDDTNIWSISYFYINSEEEKTKIQQIYYIMES